MKQVGIIVIIYKMQAVIFESFRLLEEQSHY